MRAGEKLLLQGRYKEAIEPLQAEAKRDKTDDFNIGPICDVGVAYLGSGQYVQAEKHFQRLIEDTPYRVSLHFIYAGFARWFRKQPSEATSIWREALKCHYFGDNGLDVPLVLFYAALREPSHYDIKEAEVLISRKLRDADPDYYPAYIAYFLLDRNGEETFKTRMSHVEGKNARVRRIRRSAMASFYIGLSKYRQSDKAGFLDGMQRCWQTRGFPDLFWECLVAEYEVKRAAPSAADSMKERLHGYISQHDRHCGCHKGCGQDRSR